MHFKSKAIMPATNWLFAIAILIATSTSLLAEEESSVTSGVQQTAEFYRPERVQTIHLTIAPAELAKMKAALPKRVYIPAEFRWGGVTLKNVGVRYKGNSSSQPNQKFKRSFLIKLDEFKEGQRFLGLRRVALDNGVQFGSLFSEQLITSTLRDLGVIAPRANFAKLYLNGKHHGVYTNVERIDRVFLANHFEDSSGPLYKIDMGGPGCGLTPVPESQRGRVMTFEPKSDAARKDARDVYELIDAINQTPDEKFRAVMESSMELDAFLPTIAVMLYSGAFDQLTGWGPHNYYLYRHPKDGRWHYLPWDLDVGFADFAFGRVPVVAGWNAAWPIPGGPPRPLLERIVGNPELLARYRVLADEILEKHFHPRVIEPKLDALYERIRDELALDPFPHRRVTNPTDRGFEDIIASQKKFIRLRYQTAREQLDNPGERPKPAEQRQPNGRGGQQNGQPQPSRTRTDNAPTELRLIASTSKSVTLRWNDNAKGEAGHIVQRAEGDSEVFRNVVGRPGQESILAADDHVMPGRTYRYRVFAVVPTPQGPRGSSVSNTLTVRVPKN